MSELKPTVTDLSITHSKAPYEMLGDGFILQATQANEVGEMYKMHEANRDFWATQLDHAADYTFEKLQADIEKAAPDFETGRKINYWIIKDGEKLGDVGMTFFSDDKAELGYKLVESAQGQGLATLAAKQLIDYGFQERGLKSIELHIKPANGASQRVAERLGAKIVGRTKDEKFDIWEIGPNG